MQKADRRIKCPVCTKMIEIGEPIVWEAFRWHGVDRRMPMHAHHDSAYLQAQSTFAALVARAAQESQFDPSDFWEI